MKNFFIFTVVSFFLFISCEQAKVVENTQISRNLMFVPEDSIFSLSEMNQSEWDVFYIAKPYQYSSIEAKGITIPNKVEKKIQVIASSDNSCVLIFVKNNEMKSYSIIPRNIADFSFMDKNNNGVKATEKLVLDSMKIVSIQNL